MNPRLVLHASISAVFSAAAVLFFRQRESDFLSFFVVLGQAHFLLTYLAQTRAGRMSIRRAALLVLAGALLMLPLFFTRTLDKWYTLAASMIFAAHFSADFLHMAGRQPAGTGTLGTPTHGDTLDIQSVPNVVVTSVTLLFGFLAGRILFGPGLTVFSIPISIGTLLGPVILFHYMHWYLYMVSRAKQGRYTRTYYWDVLVVNALVVAAFFICQPHPRLLNISRFFFTSPWFFAWTMLHILFTARFRLLGLGSESPLTQSV